MPLLVRTWNVFHGNTQPPERRAYLEEMVRLASADRPDVLCLQEVPAWALSELSGWSGMQAYGEIAQRPTLGPLPSTAAISRAITSLHHGLFRSALAGQANAILLAPAIRVTDRRVLALNPRRFRRAQARWLRLGLAAQLAWAKERRLCHAVHVDFSDGRAGVVANLHATSFPADQRLADAEALRAAVFVDALVRHRDLCILAGDFNVSAARSRTLSDLSSPEWGFSTPGSGIDHVLVRGTAASPPVRWSAARRAQNGRVLSDHAPVEVRIE